MINIKPITWSKEKVDCTDDIYYDGVINDIQLISIHVDSSLYSLYHHGGIIQPAGFQRNAYYNNLEDAMDAADKKIEESILALLDMRDIKIDKLLNE